MNCSRMLQYVIKKLVPSRNICDKFNKVIELSISNKIQRLITTSYENVHTVVVWYGLFISPIHYNIYLPFSMRRL